MNLIRSEGISNRGLVEMTKFDDLLASREDEAKDKSQQEISATAQQRAYRNRGLKRGVNCRRR